MTILASSIAKGFVALMATTILWGSSFPFIKLVVIDIGEYRYVWLRSLIACMALLPFVLKELSKATNKHIITVRGGLLAGIAYALGLWLQGWGTGLTTASNSAFITGLNVVFVHVYVALVLSRYSPSLAASLLLSVIGLYLFTNPTGGPNVGDILVLFGAVAWAAQVVIVDRYSRGNPLIFVFFEMLPALAFIVPDIVSAGDLVVSSTSLLMVVYLALACSVAAFTLQVYGQRYVKPEVAALIYLLEPVFAAIFANIVLGETMSLIQVIGAVMMLIAMAISTREAQKA